MPVVWIETMGALEQSVTLLGRAGSAVDALLELPI